MAIHNAGHGPEGATSARARLTPCAGPLDAYRRSAVRVAGTTDRDHAWPTGISPGIIRLMAMTLRLDEQEAEALRHRAAREGRSMQDLARQAVRDYIDRASRRELLDEVLDEELPRYAEALKRLGE